MKALHQKLKLVIRTIVQVMILTIFCIGFYSYNFFKKYLKGYQLFQNANGMNGVTGHPVVEVAGMEEHNFAEGVNLQKRVTRNVIALEILERKEIAHYCIAAKRI